MFCRECGVELSLEANFCQNCGQKISEDLIGQNQKKRVDVKRAPVWFRALFIFITLVTLSALAIAILSRDFTDTIADQLELLRQNQITQAYFNFTSKEFQEASSLADFGKFVEQHPVFSQNKDVRFIDRKVEDNIGKLEAILTAIDGTNEQVQFHLIRENDQWKVLRIQTTDGTAFVTNEEKNFYFNAKPIYDVIRDQMLQIRQNKISDAYQKFSSQDFQKTTPLNKFENFIKNHLGFIHNRETKLENLTFDNNVAKVTGNLIDDAAQVYPIEYQLIFEDGAWKILHIQVFSSDEVRRSDIQNTDNLAEINSNL